MPINDQHEKQKSKNYALLGLLVALIVILFFVAIIKVDINI